MYRTATWVQIRIKYTHKKERTLPNRSLKESSINNPVAFNSFTVLKERKQLANLLQILMLEPLKL